MVGDYKINKIPNSLNYLPKTSLPQPQKSPLNLPLIIIVGVVIILIFGSVFLFISKNNEDKTSQQEPQIEETSKESVIDENCDAFPDKLESCEPFSCEFEHPLAESLGIEDTIMKREIIGLTEDGKCYYIEELPNNGEMKCEYTESVRKAVVQYYEDISEAESASVDATINFGSGKVQAKCYIDGKEVENPLQEALDNGQCVISGYD